MYAVMQAPAPGTMDATQHVIFSESYADALRVAAEIEQDEGRPAWVLALCGSESGGQYSAAPNHLPLRQVSHVQL